MRLLFLVLSFVISSQAFAQTADSQCAHLESTDADYCYSAPAAPSDTLLVFFHGLGGNERFFSQSDLFQDLMTRLRSEGREPWVISISYGRMWLLTEVAGSKQLFSQTMNQVLPTLERKLKPEGFQHKVLMGMSMGGFNASQVLLKQPEAFEKVLLLCPAITSIGPLATNAEVQAYIDRTGASSFKIHLVQNFTRREFPTATDWDAHAPLTLAEKATRLPDTYVSCGLRDDYGFQEGAKMFYDLIQTKAPVVEWVPIPNAGHCAIDAESVHAFLVR